MKKLLLPAKMLFPFFLLFTMLNHIQCQKKPKDIYHEIVLEIPPVKITRYEYEKNLNEYINSYKNAQKTDPSEEMINHWKNEFIDKMYLLAYLIDQGFDKRQDVVNTVNSMERIILTQDYGLVYDEFVTNRVNVSEEDVMAAYEKSGKHVKLEYLRFPNRDLFSSTVSILNTNEKIATYGDFRTLTAICKKYPEITNDTLDLTWPYLGMEDIADDIYNVEKGDMIPLREAQDGVYVYCAKEVYEAEKLPYEKTEPTIKMILEWNKRTTLRSAFYNKINNVVSFQVNGSICSKFMKNYNIDLFKDIDESRKNKTLDKQFEDILKDTILTYSINSVKSFLTVKSFLESYSHSAMLPVFRDSLDLPNYLAQYARNEVILPLADSLGITKDIKFQLDKKNYKNKTLLGFFEAREIMPAIQVSDGEIEKYYREHQQEYLSGDMAEISVYTFDTQRNAFMGRRNLLQGMKNTPQKNEGLKKLDSHVTVTRNANKYSKDIIRAVFQLKDDQYSQPIKLSGDFMVIKKIKETGSIVKPLEEVRDDILQGIKKMKCDKIKNDKILLAKKKYQIKLNIIVAK